MKKVLTKIGYMAFGSLLTLIGYHFGNVDNNSANAQQALEKTENIVDKLRVRQLEIVGNDNSPRIYLGTNLDKGQIVVVDDNDVPHLTLKTYSEGGRIDVKDDTGENRITLYADKENTGQIRVFGVNPKSAVGIGSTAYGGIVQVNDSFGERRIALGVREDNTGQFSIFGSNSEILVGISSIKGDGGFVAVGSERQKDGETEIIKPLVILKATDDNGVVLATNKTGDKTVSLVAVDSNAYLEIEDDKNLSTLIGTDTMTIRNLKTEQLVFGAGMNPLGEGYVLIFDKDGTPVQAMGNTSKSTDKSTQTIEYESTIQRSKTITGLRKMRSR